MKTISRKIIGLSVLTSLWGGGAFICKASPEAAPSNHSFSLQLFRKTAEARPKENILISPLSASLALGMVVNGATGQNLQQMATVLGTTADGINQLNARNKAVMASLNANKDVTLEVANAVYADKATPFRRDFIDFCQANYGASAQNLDFKNKQATLSVINGWAAAKTHGKIPTILSDLDDMEKMVLLNAIYFKGSWAEKFDKASTREENFDLDGKRTVKKKMMHKLTTLRYCDGETFAAVSIPYVGSKQSMYVFLPNKDVSLPAFQAEFSDANWKKWMTSFRSERVNLSMPKLKINFEDSMGDTLQAMGMKLAFKPDEPGPFRNLITSPALAGLTIPGVDKNKEYIAWISRVIQKTFMEVSEEGTEAAAVTAVVVKAMCPSVVPQPRIIDFKIDRPYILALVDDQSGEILFIGKMLNPPQ